MSINSEKVKVPKGMNLEQLVASLGISKRDLRRYHNTYCPLEDLIEKDLPVHLKEVFVPSKDKILRDKILRNKTIKYQSNNNLDNRFNYNKAYGIVTQLLTEQELQWKLHYIMEVKKREKFFTLIKKDSFINNLPPETFSTEIAAEADKVFYPLELKINDSGIIEEVCNNIQIRKRWQIKKTQLKEYYVGKVSEKLFEDLENYLLTTNSIDILNKNIFFNFFFIPLYQDFGTNNRKSIVEKILIQKEMVLFRIELHLQEESLNNEIFSVFAKGSSICETYKLDFIYKLNVKNNSIKSINGTIKKSEEFVINFNCYELKNNEI